MSELNWVVRTLTLLLLTPVLSAGPGRDIASAVQAGPYFPRERYLNCYLRHLKKTPLLHILYYIKGLTHDFWTGKGGWEFDRSHGAGTSSPSHWQQVEEQAPKPVGWTMCFLLMTLVPVQKLCVNICVYVYMYVHSLYEICYRSYIQRECHSVLAKLHPITLYRGVRGSWAECHFLFSLVYQLCLALW